MIVGAMCDVKVSGMFTQRQFHRPDGAVGFTIFDKDADGCGDKHPNNSNVLAVVHALRDEMICEPIQALTVNTNNLGDGGGHGLQIGKVERIDMVSHRCDYLNVRKLVR